MYKPREKVFWFSIVSRILIVLLQLIFNVLCPDHQADAFKLPEDPNEKHSILDATVTFLFRGLTRWDAQYYIHIAKYGYTYENTLAFFPLFPKLMKYLALIFNAGFSFLNFTNSVVIVGVVLNLICFVKASLILYDLSEKVFKNTKFAYRTAILFCVNPASIFFTALYSESMFVYLTFYSMLESINNNPCVFLPLSLSSLVRSNGLVNFGFPGYAWLKNFLVNSLPNYVSENKHYHASVYSLIFNSRHIFLSILQGIFQITLCFLPYYIYQKMYIHSIFCDFEFDANAFPIQVQKLADENNFLLPGKAELPWCNYSLPTAYSYVQKKYWNVGFLKYYQLKQIPNFILALPVLYLFIKCIVEFFKEHKSKFLTLEFYTGVDKIKSSNSEKYPLDMFAFAVHGLVLTLVCILFVHIQVSTRLLCSASPLLYWYCALITLEEEKFSKEVHIEYEQNENLFSKWKVYFLTKKYYSCTEKLIYGYFLGYYVVGCFMFSNFLPWT